MAGKSLISLEELMGSGNIERRGNSNNDRSLISLEELLNEPELNRNPGYGEIFSKAAQTLGPASKSTGGQALQMLSEQPLAALQELAQNANAPQENFFDAYLNELKNQGSKLKFLSTVVPSLIGEAVTGGKLYETGKNIQQEAEKDLNSHALSSGIEDQLSVKGITDLAARGLVKNAPGLLATILTKNPAFALTQGGATSTIERYNKGREAGEAPSEALTAGAGHGLADVLLGQLPLEALLKPGATALKRIINTAVTEFGTEAATQAVQDTIDKFTINPEMSVEDMGRNILVAGLAGGVTGGALATGTAPFIKAEGGKSKKRNPKAEQEVQKENNQLLEDVKKAEEESVENQKEIKKESERLVKEESDLEKISHEDKAILEKALKKMPEEKTSAVRENQSVEEKAQPVDQEKQQNVEHEQPIEGNKRRKGAETIENEVIRPEPESKIAEAKTQEEIKPEVKNVEEIQPAVVETTSSSTGKSKTTEKPEISAKKKAKTPEVNHEALPHELTQAEFIERNKVTNPRKKVEMSLEEFAKSKGVEKLPSRHILQHYEEVVNNPGKHRQEMSVIRNNKEAVEQYYDLKKQYQQQLDKGAIKAEISKVTEGNLKKKHEQAVKNAIAEGYAVRQEILEAYPSLANLTPFMEPQVSTKLQKVASDLEDHIKEINPKANIKFVKELFGEGPALIESGAPNARKRRVAGKYERLQNLITVALDQHPTKVEKTALHEVYHSLEDSLSPQEKDILANAFPARDKTTSSERQAEAFANYIRGNKKTAQAPMVKKAFNSIAKTVGDVRKTLVNNGIKEAEEIFQAIGKGELARRELQPKEVATLVKDNDYQTIRDAYDTGSITKEAALKAADDLGSPELKKIMQDEKADFQSDAGFQEVIAETTKKPEDVAYALRDKSLFSLETAENIATKTVDIVAKVRNEKVAKALYKEVENNYDIMSKAAKGNKLWETLKYYKRLAFNTNDGFLRNLGAAKFSKAVQKIADFFYPDVGSGRSITQDYFHEKNEFVNSHLNRLGDILGNVDVATRNTIAPYLQGYKTAKAGTLLDTKVKELRALQDDISEYMRSSGLEIGEIKDYFRRIYDPALILESKDAFLKAATKAYMLTGKERGTPISEKIARKQAEEWFERVQLDDNGTGVNADFFTRSGPPPLPSSFKERSLSKDADEIMRPFLVQDPIDVMSISITQAANKVAFDRRFGGDKVALLQDRLIESGVNKDIALKLAQQVREDKLTSTAESKIDANKEAIIDLLEAEGINKPKDIVNDVFNLWESGAENRFTALKRQMIDEGLDVDDIKEVISIIKQNTGMAGREYSKGLRNFTSGIKVFSYVAHLPRTALTQLGEFGLIAAQTGDIRVLLSGLNGRVRNVINMVKRGQGWETSDKFNFLEDLSELLGVISDKAAATLGESRFGIDEASKLSKLISDRFFFKTAQSSISAADRIASVECGQLFFNRLANDIANNTSRAKSSAHLFKDYGIPEGKLTEFSNYILKANEAFAKNDINFFNQKGELGELYSTALGRFVDSVIIHPNAAMRQRIGNDPIGSLIYGFLSYNMGFSKRVLGRSYRLAKEGFKKDSGYTLADKMQLASSFAMMPAMLALGYGVTEIKELLSGKESKKTVGEKLLDSISQASLFGGIDPLFSVTKSVGVYKKSLLESIGGPWLGDVSNLVGATMKLFMGNSPNTNSAERNAVKQYYNLVALPLLNAVIPVLVPGFTLPFVALQGLNAPQTKAAVQDALAGKPYANRKRKTKTEAEKREERLKRSEKRRQGVS